MSGGGMASFPVLVIKYTFIKYFGVTNVNEIKWAV